MKEQIIEFETAKLANEVGFNSKEYVRKLYSLPTGREFHAVGAGYDMDINIEAPTQSLLQKWIRDEFNIHVFCVLHYSGSSYIYQIQELGHYFCPNFSDEYKLQYADSPYDTEWERLSYEDMLEQGLVKALQYIKEKELHDS